MGFLQNSKRKTGGSPVYHHRLFKLIIDPSENSLDNTFKPYFYDDYGAYVRHTF
jgi:hypothetical protein